MKPNQTLTFLCECFVNIKYINIILTVHFLNFMIKYVSVADEKSVSTCGCIAQLVRAQS